MDPKYAMTYIINAWLQFEHGMIDDQTFAIKVADILKPIYWENCKDEVVSPEDEQRFKAEGLL